MAYAQLSEELNHSSNDLVNGWVDETIELLNASGNDEAKIGAMDATEAGRDLIAKELVKKAKRSLKNWKSRNSNISVEQVDADESEC